MTAVEICNIALGKLGTNQISDLTDGSTEADLCELNYPLCLRAVLEARAWTFCTTRKQLTSGTPPIPLPDGWGFAYQVPNDCIRVIQLYVPNPAAALAQYQDTQFDARYATIDWERLEDFLYTNKGPNVWCKYNKFVEDPAKFTPAFIDALSTKLAMELAIPITDNPTLLDGYTKLYAAKVSDAASTEGQQGSSQQIQQPGTLVARRV